MADDTTLAIIVDRQHRLGLAQREVPARVGHGEVRVRTALVGVCATDREIVDSGAIFHVPDGEDVLVLGHEASGEVIDIGAGVTDLQPGDCVVPVVTPDRNRGIDTHGYFLGQFIEAADWLIRVPAEVADVAVLVEPLTISHHALREANALRSERIGVDLRADPSAVAQRVLVIGAGPIGLLGAFLCRVWGYTTTVLDVIEPASDRARLAVAAGCEYVQAARDGAMAVSRGSFDLVLQTAPTPEPVITYLPSLRRSGVLSLVGWQGRQREASLDLARLVREAVHEEWALVGTLGARATDFRGAVSALSAMHQRFGPAIDGLITRVCTPDRFRDAFAHRSDDVVVAIDFREGAS